MPTLETTLEDLERARRRKKDLKRQLKNLVEQLRLAKREEEMHTKRARALIQEHEYSGFTDTIKLDEPPK
jgi:hypothetical protein